MLIDSIETLQDLFLPLTSHSEGMSLLLLKNSKNNCQSNGQSQKVEWRSRPNGQTFYILEKYKLCPLDGAVAFKSPAK